jgi:general secretion pathway protein C
MATATGRDGQRTRARTAAILATLLGTAYFAASGTTQLVASRVLDPLLVGGPDRTAGAASSAAAPARRDRVAEGTAILARDIFDSQLGSMEWELPAPEVASPEESAPTEPPPPADPSGEHPRCEGAVRLVASYVRPSAPEQSFAAITSAAGNSLLYREGMRVDDRTVLRIDRMRVVMQPASGPLCDLVLFDPGATGVATARTAPAVAVAPAEPTAPAGDTGIAGIEPADLDANITAVSDTSWTVTRSLVDRLLANQAALMSAARVIPHEEDGRVVGVKIYGIRRSSLLGRLGIQNGDMLRTINGYDLTEPNSVLEAYTNLRSSDHLTLNVVRRGTATTLDYSIR